MKNVAKQVKYNAAGLVRINACTKILTQLDENIGLKVYDQVRQVSSVILIHVYH